MTHEKILLCVLLLGLLAPSAAFANELDDLKAQLEWDTAQLNEAAEKGNLKDVIALGDLIMAEAKELAKKVPANDKVALVNGEASPGFVVLKAEPAEEFVLIAKIMQGKMRLADVLKQRADLTKHQGFFGWVTANVPYMNVDFAPMAEQFRAWKNCKKELAFAYEQGHHVRPDEEVCAEE